MNESIQTVLVVDDAPLNIQVLNNTLSSEYKVIFALNGISALEIVKRTKPDIILLDIMMPDMDGYEVCRLLKQDDELKDIPVIFVTAMDNEEDEARGLSLGAIDYIVKPVSPPIVKARVKNHLELKKYRDSLTSLSRTAIRAKNDFLSNITHELRTPLNPIIGMSDILLNTPLAEDQRNYIQTIKDSAYSLLNLLDDLIDVVRLDTEVFEPKEDSFYISDILSYIAGLISPKAEKKGLVISVENSADKLPMVIGDSDALKSLINRIAQNALKFTDNGGITMGALQEKEEDGRITVRFYVRDTGIGMSKSQLDAIMSDFTQAEGSTNRRFSGIGLGMTMIKRILNLIGGTLAVQSKEGQGTTFEILLSFKVSK